MKSSSIELSIVIPVYKAEECLDELHRRLTASIAEVSVGYEIIFVDDRSPDRSWEIEKSIASSDSRVKAVRLSRNFGQHHAITAGMDMAGGNWVVVMDCDLQDRPEEIPRLYAKAKEGFEMVVAKRAVRRDPIHKKVVSFFFYKLFSFLAGVKYDGQVGNFRIVSRKVALAFNGMREDLRFFGGLLNWIGFQTGSIEVVHGERYSGKSSYTYPKLFLLASRFIIAHCDRPLTFAIYVGFISSTISLLGGAWVAIGTWISGETMNQWMAVLISIYFMGGLILITVGVLGIYLGKVFDQTKNRPLYVIDESLNINPE